MLAKLPLPGVRAARCAEQPAPTPRERAAELLAELLVDPATPYTRLRREWPDIRGDALLREGAYLVERLRHPVLDRLDEDAVNLALPEVTGLLARLRSATAADEEAPGGYSESP